MDARKRNRAGDETTVQLSFTKETGTALATAPPGDAEEEREEEEMGEEDEEEDA